MLSAICSAQLSSAAALNGVYAVQKFAYIGIIGSRYAVIGSAVGVSEANGIGQPEAGTLEALLTRLPESGLFVPTHNGEGLPISEIAARPTRSGSTKNPTYFALTPQSFTDFDWLAVLHSTAYQRGGPPLQAWDANQQQ